MIEIPSKIRVDVHLRARYSLEIRFAWSGVSLTGNQWVLNVTCQRLSPGAENFVVQVGQGGSEPSSWVTAYTCSSDTDQMFNTYPLSAVELNNGAPVVRIWDAQGSLDLTQGTMVLNVLRIDRIEYG